jgi:hypothetical protein
MPKKGRGKGAWLVKGAHLAVLFAAFTEAAFFDPFLAPFPFAIRALALTLAHKINNFTRTKIRRFYRKWTLPNARH